MVKRKKEWDWPISKDFPQGDFEKFTIKGIVEMPIFKAVIASWRRNDNLDAMRSTNVISSFWLGTAARRWIRKFVHLGETWRWKRQGLAATVFVLKVAVRNLNGWLPPFLHSLTFSGHKSGLLGYHVWSSTYHFSQCRPPSTSTLFRHCKFHIFILTQGLDLKNSFLQELPVDALGSDLSSQLRASLTVNSSNGLACAASARLWECLLEKHRLPYLLLRVADMRMVLGSKVTALSLYEEVSSLGIHKRMARYSTYVVANDVGGSTPCPLDCGIPVFYSGRGRAAA